MLGEQSCLIQKTYKIHQTIYT